MTKEMIDHNFIKIVLGTFTSFLKEVTPTDRMTTHRENEWNAILSADTQRRYII